MSEQLERRFICARCGTEETVRAIVAGDGVYYGSGVDNCTHCDKIRDDDEEVTPVSEQQPDGQQEPQWHVYEHSDGHHSTWGRAVCSCLDGLHHSGDWVVPDVFHDDELESIVNDHNQVSALRTRAEEAESERDFYARQHDLVKEDWLKACEQRDVKDAEIARLKAERDACLNREEGYRKYIQAHSDDESRITELKAQAAKGALADKLLLHLTTLPHGGENCDGVAEFELDMRALTPDAGKEVQEHG